MPNAPTKENFLHRVEQLFGSQSPNLEVFRKEVRRHLVESRKQSANTDRDAMMQRLVAKKVYLLTTAADAAQLGLNSWGKLGEQEQAQVVDLLSACEQFCDMEEYMIEHTN